MEPEFILESAPVEAARRLLPPQRAGMPRPRPHPRPRPPRRPVRTVHRTAVVVPRGGRPPGPSPGCGTLVVLGGFGPDDTRLQAHQYSELIAAVLLAAQAQVSSVEIVSAGGSQSSQDQGRRLAEAVGRQVSFYFGLAGLRPRVMIRTVAAAERTVEIRVCVT